MTNGTKTPPPVSGNGNGNGNGGPPDDFDFGEPFGENGGLKPPRTLGDLWRESMPFKLGVIGGAAALLALGFLLFGGGNGVPDAGPSGAPPSSAVEQTVGTAPLTPEMAARLEDKNRQDLEAAIAGPGSAIYNRPGTPPSGLNLPEDIGPQADPLERWRKLQEQEAKTAQPVEAPQQAPSAVAGGQPEAGAATAALAGAMSEQMTSILEGRKATTAQVMQVNAKGWLESRRQAEAEAAAAAAAAQAEAAGAQAIATQKILVPAGEIEYAQMLTEANSDVPGAVLAQIASGPLKGARLIGQFSVESDKFLAITFQTAVINGVATPIDAIALDPATTLPGMATDVDHRYLKRVILPAAAAFVEGWTQAVADSGATNVTVSGDTVIEESQPRTNTQEVNAGIAEAGQEVGDILSDIADDTEVMVKVHAGTPMGILFLAPVVERDENTPWVEEDEEQEKLDMLRGLLEERDATREEDQRDNRRDQERDQERLMEDVLGRGRYSPYSYRVY